MDGIKKLISGRDAFLELKRSVGACLTGGHENCDILVKLEREGHEVDIKEVELKPNAMLFAEVSSVKVAEGAWVHNIFPAYKGLEFFARVDPNVISNGERVVTRFVDSDPVFARPLK